MGEGWGEGGNLIAAAPIVKKGAVLKKDSTDRTWQQPTV